MKIRKSIIFIFFLFFGSVSLIFSQSRHSFKSIIKLEFDKVYVNVDNPLKIVAQQNETVSINQVEANLKITDSLIIPLEIRGDKGYFSIRPDTIGIVEIKVTIDEVIEATTFRVHPIRIVGYLGSMTGSTDEKIGVSQFLAQRGIQAKISCCYISGRCNLLGFQLIRIGSRNQIERSINKGGIFEGRTREIIDRASPGDLYIFRNIRYRCSSSDQIRRLNDMVFEIE